MIRRVLPRGPRTEAWIHGLPGESRIGGAPAVVLGTMPFEPHDRRINFTLEVEPRVSECLRGLQRSKQVLGRLVVVVRDGQEPRPNTAYTMTGARVESVISPTQTATPEARIHPADQVTFTFETWEVAAGWGSN